VLPIHEPKVETITALDARDATAPPRFEVKAPQGAPNVVIVLIDDIGFGHSSAFGGPIQMPTLEKLANAGLRVRSLPHHRAVQPHPHCNCSLVTIITRTTLVPSWNWPPLPGEHRQSPPEHHAPGPNPAPEWLQHRLLLANITRLRLGRFRSPGLLIAGLRFRLRQILRVRRGRDRSGGRLPSTTASRVSSTNRHPDYHFTVDMTDQAINWFSAQKALTPDKPFYMYFATGATHAPHHAPKEWIEKYKGQFSGGWDKLARGDFRGRRSSE